MDFNVDENDPALDMAEIAEVTQPQVTQADPNSMVEKRTSKKKTSELDQLVSMGFPRKRARLALNQTNNVDEAFQLLLVEDEIQNETE